MDKKVENKLVRILRNHKLTRDELAERMNVEPGQVKSWIGELDEKGIDVDVTRARGRGKMLYHINVLPDQGNVYHISGKERDQHTMRFAASSDWHLASKFHLPKTLDESLKRVVDEGISTVYVAGDLMDGVKIYRGHLENLLAFSVEDQTDMVAEVMSRFPDLTFWGISGNHDYSFTKQNGVKPLSILEGKVDNFINVGDLKADIIYKGIRIRMLHGAGGRAYATSYPTQTYLRDYFKGLEREQMKDIPHVMIVGHYHTLYRGKDHGIQIIQAGSFQDGDNEYCVRR